MKKLKRKERIIVDLKLQQFNPLKLKQFDTTELEMVILDNSLNVDLTDLSVYIIFTKPNGTIVMQSTEITKQDNVVNVVLLENCLRLPGKANIEIELKKGTEIVSSFYIPAVIEKSSKENITSDDTPNFIEIFENAVAEEEKRIANETARQNAEETRKDAEAERVTNENNRENAETNRSTAENERIASETNRNASETNRVEAETLRATAENARDTAEQARIEAEEARALAEEERQKNGSYNINIYTMTIEADTELGAEVELPFWYKVGNGSLHQIQFENWVLLKAINVDTEGQYYEVGQDNSLSNKIRLASDAEIKAR